MAMYCAPPPPYNPYQPMPPAYLPNGGVVQHTYYLQPMVHPRAPMQPGFRVGVCQCNSARTEPNRTVLNAVFCPYCTAARQLNVLEGRSTSPFHWICALALIGDIASLIIPFVTYQWAWSSLIVNGLCVENCIARRRLRIRLGILPNSFEDLCISWVMPMCAVAQQQTEMKLADMNPGAFCEEESHAPRLQIEMR